MSAEHEILELLMEDDEFIRSYPTFKHWMAEWDEKGGEGASRVPEQILYDFYAEKTPVDDALHTWFTYNA